MQAYLWGYPAVSFESIRLTANHDLGIDFNDLGIADNFVDPTVRGHSRTLVQPTVPTPDSPQDQRAAA